MFRDTRTTSTGTRSSMDMPTASMPGSGPVLQDGSGNFPIVKTGYVPATDEQQPRQTSRYSQRTTSNALGSDSRRQANVGDEVGRTSVRRSDRPKNGVLKYA